MRTRAGMRRAATRSAQSFGSSRSGLRGGGGAQHYAGRKRRRSISAAIESVLRSDGSASAASFAYGIASLAVKRSSTTHTSPALPKKLVSRERYRWPTSTELLLLLKAFKPNMDIWHDNPGRRFLLLRRLAGARSVEGDHRRKTVGLVPLQQAIALLYRRFINAGTGMTFKEAVSAYIKAAQSYGPTSD